MDAFSLVNVNAYNQPGVEAGIKAATELLQLQRKVRAKINQTPQTTEGLAAAISADAESACQVLEHLCANDPTVKKERSSSVAGDKFFLA
jgi:glucose-6-phosphate isomerase